MAPPFRHPFEADETSRLRRNAVRRDQFLLLADGAHKAKRVRPEPKDPNDRQDRQRADGACGDTSALTPVRRGKDRERKHYARRGLDADRNHDRNCGGPQARCDAGRQHERHREQEQH